jgi:hypothetical protein
MIKAAAYPIRGTADKNKRINELGHKKCDAKKGVHLSFKKNRTSERQINLFLFSVGSNNDGFAMDERGALGTKKNDSKSDAYISPAILPFTLFLFLH